MSTPGKSGGCLSCAFDFFSLCSCTPLSLRWGIPKSESEAEHLYTNLVLGEVSMIMSELAQAFARVLNTWAEVLHALHVACLDIVPYCYYSR